VTADNISRVCSECTVTYCVCLLFWYTEHAQKCMHMYITPS